MSLLIAGIGGFFGAVARFGATLVFRLLGKPGHFATIFVNWLGAFLMGVTVHSVFLDPEWKTFLAAGFLGAFTTFSTFMLDAVQMMEKDKQIRSLLYILVTLIGGILLFIVGWNL